MPRSGGGSCVKIAEMISAELFAAKSRWGITGYDWLVDHVHPTIIGH